MKSLQQKFDEFDAANPEVYTRLRRLALKLKWRGVPQIGIATLYETLRYNYAFKGGAGEYKLNNNYRAFYARKLMANEAELAGFFETRRQPAAPKKHAWVFGQADERGLDGVEVYQC